MSGVGRNAEPAVAARKTALDVYPGYADLSGECLRFRAAIRSNRVGGNRPFISLDRREADLFPFAADLDTSATSTSFASMRFRFL